MNRFRAIGFGLNQRGSFVFIVPLIALVSLTALGLTAYLSSFDRSLAISSAKVEMQKLNAAALARAEQYMKSPGHKCDIFEDFRNLLDSSRFTVKISDKTKAVPCYLSSEEANSLVGFEMTFERVSSSNDLPSLSTHIKVAVSSSRQPVVGPIVGAKSQRSYILRTARAVDFALILKGNSPSPVSVSEGSRLFIEGSTLHTGATSLELSSLLLGNKIEPRLEFRGYFHSRASHFQYQKATENFSREHLMRVARYGLQSGVFKDVTLSFEENPASWNQRIDWGYMYSGAFSGYPLPELKGGVSSLSGQGVAPGDKKPFSADRAAINAVPDSRTLERLDKSCEIQIRQTGFLRSFIRLQSNDDFTINFTHTSGSTFCGLVAANNLKINVSNGGKPVALIGTFLASKVSVTGSSPVYIVRPGQSFSLPRGVELPSAQSLSGLAVEQSMLGTSIAHNFYVPFLQKGGTIPNDYRPQTLDRFFTPVGCDPGHRCWKEKVNPLSLEPLFEKDQRKDLVYTMEPSS